MPGSYFAQAAEPLAPWAQVLIQLGALAVLVLLAWQIPRVMTTLKDWREAADEAHRQERKEILERQARAREEVLAVVRGLKEELSSVKDQLSRLKPQ